MRKGVIITVIWDLQIRNHSELIAILKRAKIKTDNVKASKGVRYMYVCESLTHS